MASVSGACVISKVSGLLQIREDTVPSKLMWKAIDQDKSMEIPLNKLSKLQASPDSSPKMLLKLFYTAAGSQEVKDIKLTFNNRQTMNAVKETLQTIVARQKTVIRDSPAPATESGTATPAGASENLARLTPQPGDPLDFSHPGSLSDASLLKNRHLQQKLLLEDKTLRNIFTESVINFKLSPALFWSTRTGQLRTYALTISQHRGPYNVLSSIKPVATSDNQVNVNVTRDVINEIFTTYPIIRHAFDELVPHKLSEGEFWSRFFNSKLFRRLRGDRINTANTRGDVVIDKYLYVDADFVEEEKSLAGENDASTHHVDPFLDLQANEEDNPQKLGLLPDFTMKFSDDDKNGREQRTLGRNENEMMILMRNMNTLSSKMINITSEQEAPAESAQQMLAEHEKELAISDLNDVEQPHYVPLDLDMNSRHATDSAKTENADSTPLLPEETRQLWLANVFEPTDTGINLSETYERADAIAKANADVTALVKHNFRVFKLEHNIKDPSAALNFLREEEKKELTTYNMTITEFLLHFWNLFLNGGNPAQLKKLFTNLRNCQSLLDKLEKKITEELSNHDLVKLNEKLREKLTKDVVTCLAPLNAGLTKACNEYMEAYRKSDAESNSTPASEGNGPAINENGKRPLQV